MLHDVHVSDPLLETHAADFILFILGSIFEKVDHLNAFPPFMGNSWFTPPPEGFKALAHGHAAFFVPS
jgi:hypothetical protein